MVRTECVVGMSVVSGLGGCVWRKREGLNYPLPPQVKFCEVVFPLCVHNILLRDVQEAHSVLSKRVRSFFMSVTSPCPSSPSSTTSASSPSGRSNPIPSESVHTMISMVMYLRTKDRPKKGYVLHLCCCAAICSPPITPPLPITCHHHPSSPSCYHIPSPSLHHHPSIITLLLSHSITIPPSSPLHHHPPVITIPSPPFHYPSITTPPSSTFHHHLHTHPLITTPHHPS